MKLGKYRWALTFAIAASAFLILLLLAGRDNTLGIWGIHTLKPDFVDTRGITSGTFVLGNNWDYRLIFLLFTFPYLSLAIRSADPWVARVSTAVLATALVSLWHIAIYHGGIHFPFGSEAGVLLDECSNWFTFLGPGFLLGQTQPGWLRYRGTDAAPSTAQPQ